jgi:bifunctional ADP-heptose synthase (sugar kinase/adenylyltransferase)
VNRNKFSQCQALLLSATVGIGAALTGRSDAGMTKYSNLNKNGAMLGVSFDVSGAGRFGEKL